MAERCALFVIICLGESIIVSGRTFAEAEYSRELTAAFVADFATTCAMWWIYFHLGHERATHLIEASSDPGRVARSVFTYAHIPIVAGIILSAVGAEFTLAHPQGHSGLREASAVIGGPALFLMGNIWSKTMTSGRVPLSHLVGLVLLALVGSLHFLLPPWGMAVAVALALALVAAWEILGQPKSSASHH
jgi:low temperature requirement protein LtrA